MAFELPEDLKQEYGVDLTPEIKQQIVGGNIARLYGIDVPASWRRSRTTSSPAAAASTWPASRRSCRPTSPGPSSRRSTPASPGPSLGDPGRSGAGAPGCRGGQGPGGPTSIAELGLLDEVEVDGGRVTVRFHLTSPLCPAKFAGAIGQEIRRKVARLPGVESVEVVLTDHFMAEALHRLINEGDRFAGDPG